MWGVVTILIQINSKSYVDVNFLKILLKTVIERGNTENRTGLLARRQFGSFKRNLISKISQWFMLTQFYKPFDSC